MFPVIVGIKCASREFVEVGTCQNRLKEILKMRLTKDKRVMILGVPATRNTWIWDCLSEELIDRKEMDEYEKNFGKFAIINPNGKRRADWPNHSRNE